MKERRWFARLTPVSILHYVRLVYRSCLFLAALIYYIVQRFGHSDIMIQAMRYRPLIVKIIWAVFVIEMIGRMIPSKMESPGSQKQFARNYIKSGSTDISIQDNNAAVLVMLIWIGMNSVFGVLYLSGILDEGIMLLLCCAYSVCDMICILFFCPFQSWFLKNKCCSTCRIYNWDYAMMFTPLLFVRSLYAWSLFALSLILMLRWEILLYRYPERFAETTNDYLRCANCTEKLCVHKKQLRSLWQQVAEFTEARLGRLKIEGAGILPGKAAGVQLPVFRNSHKEPEDPSDHTGEVQ